MKLDYLVAGDLFRVIIVDRRNDGNDLFSGSYSYMIVSLEIFLLNTVKVLLSHIPPIHVWEDSYSFFLTIIHCSSVTLIISGCLSCAALRLEEGNAIFKPAFSSIF